MTPKTKGFVKYGVIIIIIAVILGGCKKDGKPDDSPTPTEKDSTLSKPGVDSTSQSIENQKAIDKLRNVKSAKISEVVKIALTAKGWNIALRNLYAKPAPNMTLKDINGKQQSISALKGKNAIIIKWSSRHEQAKQMLETLVEVQSEIGAEDLAIIAISSDDPAILKPIAESMDIQFPLVGRPHRLVDPYRTIRDTPVCFFIDKTGKIQLIAQKNIPAETVKALLEAM